MYKELLKLLTHKEKKMSDETPNHPRITFDGGDYKPKRLASGLIGFRAPFDFTVENGKSREIDLQMICSHTLLVVPEFQSEPIVIGAQGKIVIKLVNDHGEALQFTAGDVIARAQPLLPVPFEIG